MTLDKLIDGIRQQDYPLVLDEGEAAALCECISNIMDMVPDDDQILVRGDYDLVTSALYHPTGAAPRTNELI